VFFFPPSPSESSRREHLSLNTPKLTFICRYPIETKTSLFVPSRIFITLFSLLLILVEFPGVFPFLRHSTPSYTPSEAIDIARTTTSPSSSSLSSPSSSSSMSRSMPSSFERLLPKSNVIPSHPSSSPHHRPPVVTVPPLYVINWIPRGILYAFLGLVILEQSIVVLARDQARHASTTSRFLDGVFVVISGWVMIASGAMYVLLGAFCLQGVMERVRYEDGERWREYYERVDEMEDEMEDAKERKLIDGGGIHAMDSADEGMGGGAIGRASRRCWLGFLRWNRGCDRRRRQWNRNGLCQLQLKCRTIDWKW
jgi:hypothetical protein